MCRLILAHGNFDPRSVLAAALDMSQGRTAQHDGPIQRHPNGWGAVWKDRQAPSGLAVHRDGDAMTDAALEFSPVWNCRTNFLAVHVRHATLTRNIGDQYTHPLQRERSASPWFFMHNGFMPTVHKLLGLPASSFDSAEYFDYLLSLQESKLDPERVLDGLEAVPEGGTSGNAIIVNAHRAWLVHYTPRQSSYPSYFTMHRLQGSAFTICSSEVIPRLGSPEQWQTIPAQSILELNLTGQYELPIAHQSARASLVKRPV